MKKDNTELFENTPVSKAVITLVIPTVISQIITVIYNMADTFFIGQMNDPDQAALLLLPLYMGVSCTCSALLFSLCWAQMPALMAIVLLMFYGRLPSAVS